MTPFAPADPWQRLNLLAPWPDENPYPDVKPVGRPAKGLRQALSAIEEAQGPIVLEIGAEFGGSTRRFLTERPDSTVISIDPWPNDYPTHNWPHITAALNQGGTMRGLFQAFNWPFRDRLFAYQGSSPTALVSLKDLDINPSLIYIDGDHRYEAVLRDLSVCDALYSTAVLCGDDWNFAPRAKKYRGIDLPVRYAVQDFCTLNSYGYSSRDDTWTIHRSDDPPELRQETPEGMTDLREVSERLTALEAAVRQTNADRIVPTLRRLVRQFRHRLHQGN